MNLLLWVLQVALAFLYPAGEHTKRSCSTSSRTS